MLSNVKKPKKNLISIKMHNGIFLTSCFQFSYGESITAEDAELMIKDVDRKGDGKLVFEEFKNLYSQRSIA